MKQINYRYHFESHQHFLYTLSATVLNKNNISIGYHNSEINKKTMKQHSIWKKVCIFNIYVI